MFQKMKILSSLFTLVLICFTCTQIQAQNEEYRHTITGNVGASGVGIIVGLLDLGNTDSLETATGINNFKAFARPALQLNYDFGLVKWFSVGAGISYQKMGVSFEDLEWDLAGEAHSSDFSGKLGRLNISIRPLFHYANNGKVDLYSGFRLGVTDWIFNVQATDLGTDEDAFFEQIGIENPGIQFADNIDATQHVPNFAFQVIPFGMRAYITDNIGLNFETALGAPHFFSGGLSVRF